MDERTRRGRRRLWAGAVYVLLWLLTMLGTGQSEPRWFGVPAWYIWSTAVLLVLVPVNFWFVSRCWPVPAGPEGEEKLDA